MDKDSKNMVRGNVSCIFKLQRFASTGGVYSSSIQTGAQWSKRSVSAWFAGSFQREAAKRTVEIFRSGK
jgi:hypothetical protein